MERRAGVMVRMRKLKEERAMSDMRKLMNRRQFGVAAQNYADEAMGLEYGSLESSTGDIRRVVAKKMKMRTLLLFHFMRSAASVEALRPSFLQGSRFWNGVQFQFGRCAGHRAHQHGEEDGERGLQVFQHGEWLF